MTEDSRWKEYLDEVPLHQETPVRPAAPLNGQQRPQGFEEWYGTNVYRQRQVGYAVASTTLPLGDISSWQMRQLADIARQFAGENVRTTVEQNMLLRWVSEADLTDLYLELKRIGLSDPGAGSIVDVTACPGTDTCKLGISSSRGLASEIRKNLAAKFVEIDEAVRGLRIKISGCFNSCGQHHIADIGFYGTSRTINSHKVPHFQVVLGGQWTENAAAYGLAMGSVPAKSIPKVLDRLTERYVQFRQNGESFQTFVSTVGKKEMRSMFEDLMQVPPYEQDTSFYADWGDPREFSIGDMGTGECAGEVVSLVEFDMAAAERIVFEAQLKLEDEDYAGADKLGYGAMLEAATALIKTEFLDVPNNPETIVREFKRRFYDTQLFHDKYAGGKFAHYLFRRYESAPTQHSRDTSHRLVEEAQLFIEAAHACRERIAESMVPLRT